MFRVGTAGWSIPKPHQERFPDAGTHLERYANRFSAVEINSSFYRSHRPATYQRWAESVGEHFQFSVKVPKEITHTLRLCDAEELLAEFLREASALGQKLGPLLVQLPPSFEFQSKTVRTFLHSLRQQFAGDVVCEPRHASWVERAAEKLLKEFRISRVIADPAVIPNPSDPCDLVYYRLHGSPRVYYSPYSPAYLADLTGQLTSHRDAGRRVWCIFDNTAIGAAVENGMQLLELLQQNPPYKHDAQASV